MSALARTLCIIAITLCIPAALAEIRWDDTCQVLTKDSGLTFDQATKKMLDEVVDTAKNALNAIDTLNHGDPWEYFRIKGTYDLLFTNTDQSLTNVKNNLASVADVRNWEQNIYIMCNDQGLLYPQGDGKTRTLKATGNSITYTGELKDRAADCGWNDGTWAVFGYGFKPPAQIENWEYIVLCANRNPRHFLSDWKANEYDSIDNYLSLGGTLFHELMHRGPNHERNLETSQEFYRWANCLSQRQNRPNPDDCSRNPESVVLFAVALSQNRWLFVNGFAANRREIWDDLVARGGQNIIQGYGLVEPQ